MVSTSIDEETGEERKRLINRMRWKGYGPASIMFSDAQVCLYHCFLYSSFHTSMQVPDKPPQAVEEGRALIDQKILRKLEEVCPTFWFRFIILIGPLLAIRRTPGMDENVIVQPDGTS